MVLPGVAEVMASERLPVSIFISEDLPTLERPIKAYSCMAVLGHLSTSGLLVTKHALDIFIVKTLSSGRLQSFAKVTINHELFKFRSIWLVLLYIVISLYAYFAYALC